LKNQKNYNNGIGHPLTVLRLIKEGPYDIAVLEMAMSTPMHEIARLCEITPPDIAVVLTVLPVHIEHLGTIEAIAAAKQEIVEGMKPNGTAILNADDFRVAAMEKAAKGEVITFGIEKDADIMASEIVGSGFGKTKFNLHLKGETIEVEFPLNGRHNVMNALAASAAAYKLGLDAKAIAEGLRHVKPPYQRGEVIYLNNNIIVVNDSYNSNPESLVKMAEMFCEAARDSKRKILVAGEMLELGNYAEQMHKQAGEKLAALPIDVLIGVRGNAKLICEAAQSHGIKQIEFTDDSKTAAELLTNLVEEGDAVLVKGSRGVQTEIVVERLVEKFGNKDPKTLSN
jgi:UDP-N-acetylmuramoyl-tripeptide--D-alanyl-D-alanine ligase